MRLVIVLAEDAPQPRAIAATLRDWSALGLLEPFIWVSVAPGQPAADLVGDVIDEGRAQRIRLVQFLADARGIERIQLCALTTLGSTPAAPAADVCSDLRGHLSSKEAAGQASFVHLVTCAADSERATLPIAWPQWHNLVLSPEDSRTPGGGVNVQLLASGDPTIAEANACSALACATGLWRGVNASVFDVPEQTAGEPGVRILRTFYRLLDTREVTAELRHRVLSMADGLPRPHQGQIQLEHVDRPTAAAATVWDGVARKHAALFTPSRVAIPRPARERVTLGRAFTMFFSFLSRALRDAPRVWVQSVISSVSGGIATTATRTLFGGDDSAFEVVVRGNTGRPPGSADLFTAVEALTVRTQQAFPEAEMRAGDHSEFWYDVLRSGIGLADGSPPSPGLEPARAGATQGIMPSADGIVIAPDGDLPITGSFAATLGRDRLSAVDRLETEQQVSRLDSDETRVPSPEQERARAQINEWQGRVDTTYMGRVGLALGGLVKGRRDEVARIWGELQSVEENAVAPASLVAAQERLARRLKWWLLALVIALIATGVAVGLKAVKPVPGVGIGVFCVVVWLFASLSTFIRGQRELFILLHRQKAQQLAVPAMLQNLQNAVRELNTASVLYQQHVQWTPVLSQFLHAPFGRHAAAPAERPPCVMRTNLGFAVATAEPDAESLRITNYQLTQLLYSTGWLQELWTLQLHNAVTAVDPAANPNFERVYGELLRDRGIGSSSRLPAITHHLQTHGVSTAGADRHWASALTSLRQQPQLMNQLLTRITPWNAMQVGTGWEFLGELYQQLPAEPMFDNAIVASHARSGRWRAGWSADVSATVGAPQIRFAGPESPPALPTGAAQAPAGLDNFVMTVLVGGSVPERHLTIGTLPTVPEQDGLERIDKSRSVY